MEVTVETSGHLKKDMKTSRQKSGDDEIVTCSVSIKGLRVDREDMEELGGWPIGALGALYNDQAIPYQRASFLVPDRVLAVTGWIEHRKDSGAALARLTFTRPAIGADLRFYLDAPDETKTPGALMSFSLTWKAAGDEVEDVEPLLKRKCFLKLKFKEEDGTQAMFPPPPAAPPLDRKRQAAGEKETDNDERPRPPAPSSDGKVVPIGRGKKKGGKATPPKRKR